MTTNIFPNDYYNEISKRTLLKAFPSQVFFAGRFFPSKFKKRQKLASSSLSSSNLVKSQINFFIVLPLTC